MPYLITLTATDGTYVLVTSVGRITTLKHKVGSTITEVTLDNGESFQVAEDYYDLRDHIKSINKRDMENSLNEGDDYDM